MARKNKKKRGHTPEDKAETAWYDLWSTEDKQRIKLLDEKPTTLRVIERLVADYDWAEALLKKGQEGLLLELLDQLHKNQTFLYCGKKYRVVGTNRQLQTIYIYQILALYEN